MFAAVRLSARYKKQKLNFVIASVVILVAVVVMAWIAAAGFGQK